MKGLFVFFVTGNDRTSVTLDIASNVRVIYILEPYEDFSGGVTSFQGTSTFNDQFAFRTSNAILLTYFLCNQIDLTTTVKKTPYL